MSKLEQFKLHPSVIYSLIREQAGSPEKAIAELVMNSIDAGAKNIYLDISAEKFSIKDDGLGFKDEVEIENFFGTFGTPHRKGDSTYGQFRLGRGQSFAIAMTQWRSGSFGMTVDLACKGKEDTHGYNFHEFGKIVAGCEITGDFYESLHIFDGVQSPYVFDMNFADQLARYLKKPNFAVFDGDSFFKRLVCNICLIRNVNIYLNGHKVSGLLFDQGQLIAETDTANYYHTKSSCGGMVLLNQGIFIAKLNFCLPMVVDFKQSPNLNIARNQINAECPIFITGRKELYKIVFDSWADGLRWAKPVGKVISEGFVYELGQFDKELFESIQTIEDRLKFAKTYKVAMVGVDGVKEVTLYEALEHAKTNKVYLNNHTQNNSIAPKYYQSIVENIDCCENPDGSPIKDYLLIDVNASLRIKPRYEDGVSYNVPASAYWFEDFPLTNNILGHTFYSFVGELESDTLSRISIKKTSTAPKNESLRILGMFEETRINIDASKSWVAKNDLARQKLEDGLFDFQQGLVEMLNNACDSIPDILQLSTGRKVIPFLVRKLNHSSVQSKVYTLHNVPYLVITEEDFAQGNWMSKYLEYLFSLTVADFDSTYENSKFNTDFHNEIQGASLYEIYKGLQEVGLQASSVLVKKPMRGSRKDSTNNMKGAWNTVFSNLEGVLDHGNVAESWRAFNNINTI